ncbi:hypothetical protein F5H01DRAFT_357307 [Linnemannia elongata]|nr:hypothetical protein F5H01DRAFT_357307 [Linnemannia elongata]
MNCLWKKEKEECQTGTRCRRFLLGHIRPLVSLASLSLLAKGIGISPGDLLGLPSLELCFLCLLLLLLAVLRGWWWCGFPGGRCKEVDEFHRDIVSDVCCQWVVQVDVAQFICVAEDESDEEDACGDAVVEDRG